MDLSDLARNLTIQLSQMEVGKKYFNETDRGREFIRTAIDASKNADAMRFYTYDNGDIEVFLTKYPLMDHISIERVKRSKYIYISFTHASGKKIEKSLGYIAKNQEESRFLLGNIIHIFSYGKDSRLIMLNDVKTTKKRVMFIALNY